MSEQSPERQHAIAEFQHAATQFIRDPSPGTSYALQMAAEECKLHGVDPSAIRPPAGYPSERRGKA